MKKTVCVLLCLAIIAVMAGCGNGNANHTANKQSLVEDALQAGVAAAEAAETAVQPEAETVADEERQAGLNENAPAPTVEADETTVLSTTEGIDVDLTSLSSTMVYSEVYGMMTDPGSYIGKTVKMGGVYASFHDENTGNNYFACIIQDATACCAQGIEFVLTDDYAYPEDYPEEGGIITVTGVFDTYTEGEYTYCTLRNAKLV